MQKDLFNFSFEHWPVLLLSLIPALINLSIFAYILIFVKRSALSSIFLFFLFTLLLWRIEEAILFISVTEETARLWEKMLTVPTSFIAASGLHFILLLIHKEKIKTNYPYLILIYLPSLLSSMLIVSDIARFSYKHVQAWGWVLEPGDRLSVASLMLIGIQAFLMYFFLSIHVWKLRRSNSIDFKRARVILMGLSIPVFAGLIYQIILPIFFHFDPIPIASASIIFFSLSVLIAMTKYDFLDFSPRYQWDSIIENMNEGILIADRMGIVRYVNNKFCSITGYSNADILGKYVRDTLLFPEDRQTVHDMVVRNEISFKDNYELRIRKKDGEPIICEINSRPYIDTKNKIAGSIRIYNDITKRKKAEEDLMEKMNEMDAFIYRASHDLRGPLASIAGLISLARVEIKDRQAAFYFDKVFESAARLDEILQELSKLGRVSQAKISLSEIDLKKEIDDVLDSLKHLPNCSFIEFKIEINIPVIYTDKILLIIILQNLIINSINYYDEKKNKPFVHISANETGAGVEIIISDNGLGIPAAIQEKVFEMFYRGNTGSKGSGLGLYIVKNALKRIKGTIHLQSQDGSGTTLKVILPKTAPFSHEKT